MTATPSLDQEIYRIATASVRRHSMQPEKWTNTVIGVGHPKVLAILALRQGELVISSGYFTDRDWWAITTQRIASAHEGVSGQLDPHHKFESSFGNFKGIKRSEAPSAPLFEMATITSIHDGAVVRFAFETGKAAMAPIYACMFWSRVDRYQHK